MSSIRSTSLSFMQSSPPIAAGRRCYYGYLTGRVIAESNKLRQLPHDVLRTRARELRWKVQSSNHIQQLAVPAFGLIRELIRRQYDMQPHPVQILGAITMLHGGIAEMQTGEGKTLTALMPVILRALAGFGCHVVTVNDYLAARDAAFARPLFKEFGLSVGTITHDVERHDREKCYAADVTYGTEKEFGFDYLRDRLEETKNRSHFDEPNLSKETQPDGSVVQRGRYFALVDEADSLLIDQARTPMIISMPQSCSDEENVLMKWCHRIAQKLNGTQDYQYQPNVRSARLTRIGCRLIALMPRPHGLGQFQLDRVYNQIERAIVAKEGFIADRDFLVVDGKVEIIDEGTGRLLPGRKWRDGLQQAIEIQAGVDISQTTGTAARITLQNYLTGYSHLCGMTGTVSRVRQELTQVYGTPVTRIPTHLRCQRRVLSSRIFRTTADKFNAVAEEIRNCLISGRAVLVGTSTVSASERCAEVLQGLGIDATILHARHHALEAGIVAEAGQAGRVTVATNMAGRGTDIKISDAVRAAGGLHVISTEMNRSARIDRQLMGRTARQGDPGSYRAFVSLEDHLLDVLGPTKIHRLKSSAERGRHAELTSDWLKWFHRAQAAWERIDLQDRKRLMKEERRRVDRMNRLGFDACIDFLEEAAI